MFFDVVVSCVGVFAINNAGGSILSIQNALGKKAGLALNTAAILCVGMLIAPPRCAATTFEMAIAPWFGDAIGLLPFSVAFFAVVLLLTLAAHAHHRCGGQGAHAASGGRHRGHGHRRHRESAGTWWASPETDTVVADGVLAGYQTMDILAVVGFSILVQESVRAAGYGEKRDQMRVTARASLVACVLLAVIYGGLTYLGATSASVVPHTVSQAELITMIVWKLMGEAGVAVLGIVVGLACLTTAIGLCGATADYVERITMRRVSYRTALIVVVVAALLICNLGLTNIIALASPILSVVCPPFMTTVVLSAVPQAPARHLGVQGGGARRRGGESPPHGARSHRCLRVRRSRSAVRLRFRVALAVADRRRGRRPSGPTVRFGRERMRLRGN